jgi:hypothetical protein
MDYWLGIRIDTATKAVLIEAAAGWWGRPPEGYETPPLWSEQIPTLVGTTCRSVAAVLALASASGTDVRASV